MSDLPNLLIIDDDQSFSPLIAEFMEGKGFQVTLCYAAEDGLRAFSRQNFDLCILDVKMPIKDGFVVAEEIRRINPNAAFIFLSGESSRDKKIQGLTLGADDYITKPFSLEELYLRVTNILRRTRKWSDQGEKNATLQIGKYRFETNTRDLILNERSVKLSTIEAKLLYLLCTMPNCMISREFALKRIWSDEDMLHSSSLNVYISKLRHHLRDDPEVQILNLHGEGYRLVLTAAGPPL